MGSTLKARLCPNFSISKKFCEPLKIYIPVRPTSSVWVCKYENSPGTCYVSSRIILSGCNRIILLQFSRNHTFLPQFIDFLTVIKLLLSGKSSSLNTMR